MKLILRKIGRRCYVNSLFPYGCKVKPGSGMRSFREEKHNNSRIKDCAMLNERRNNPISLYTNIKIRFFTMVCISISFDQNRSHIRQLQGEKMKRFLFCCLPTSIHNFLPLFPSSFLSIKKEFIGFWLYCWCGTEQKQISTSRL